MKHTKKILSQYFNAILNGTKTFEIRKEDDCKYNVGDLIELKEVEMTFMSQGRPIVGGAFNYTFRKQLVEVTYRLDSNDFPEGIKDGYVVLGIRLVSGEDVRCNNCHARQSRYLLDGDQIEYCGGCGQRIDWSDEE